MAIGEGEETPSRISPNRMDSLLAKRISSSSQTTRLPNYTVAFHHSEEIGPGLLAQIAKKAGLGRSSAAVAWLSH